MYNHYWFSKKQRAIVEKRDKAIFGRTRTYQVLVDGVWHDYTNWILTSSPDIPDIRDDGYDLDDAVLVAKSAEELPLRIDGVIQPL